MPARPFVDYYRILEVPPSASLQEIRRSFRRLVLQAHPDKNPDHTEWSERRIRELIQAYEVVGDSEKRGLFDVEYKLKKRSAPQKPRESEFFFFKKSDPGALALRILYYLLHGRGREAVPLLLRMEAKHGDRFLADKLDRGDYLDCLFLLGEYFLGQREYRSALDRMRAFYLHERNARYPRHYLDAVVAHLKDLYLKKIPQSLPPEEALTRLEEAADLQMGARERALFARVAEELRARLPRTGAAKRTPMRRRAPRPARSSRGSG